MTHAKFDFFIWASELPPPPPPREGQMTEKAEPDRVNPLETKI